MPDLVSTLGVAALVFAATNVDDILLLAAFFADPHLKARSVVLGQFIGIAILVLASALAGAAALVVPPGYAALLGAVPLGLGLRRLWQLRAERRRTAVGYPARDEGAVQEAEPAAESRGRSQVLAVTGVTLANGGDNLAVYIPLFASAPRTIPIYVAVFAAMTAVWCLAGYALVNNRVMGHHVRRVGQVALPFVLVVLGLWILSGARALLG